MTAEEMKDLVRRYQAAHNANDLDALGDIVAEDIVSHKTLRGLPPGRNGGKLSHQGTVAALPDLNYVLDDLIAEGDRVAVRWTMTATHTGAEMMGLPASGRRLNITGISIFRIAGGKIVEHWAEPDSLAFARQLGLIPEG